MQQIHQPQLSGRHFQDQGIFKPDHLIFHHRDQDATCTGVSQILKPHRLRVMGASQQFSAQMHCLNTQSQLSIYRLEYSEAVSIEPDVLEQFYLIQIPTQGYAEIQCQSHKFMSYVQMASLISPNHEFKMHWHAASPQIILKISKQDFIQHCRAHFPQSNFASPEFDAKLDLSQQHGAFFLQLLKTLIDASTQHMHPLQHAMVFKQFESSLYNALLYGQPSNLQPLLQQQASAPVLEPHYIKKVEEYLRAHLHEELNIEHLAIYAGVSVRSLFHGFKHFKGISPMAFLKNLRFEHAHHDLTQRSSLSITEIAYKWGFSHLGRFSQEYKQRYGVLPSITRNQAM